MLAEVLMCFEACSNRLQLSRYRLQG